MTPAALRNCKLVQRTPESGRVCLPCPPPTQKAGARVARHWAPVNPPKNPISHVPFWRGRDRAWCVQRCHGFPGHRRTRGDAREIWEPLAEVGEQLIPGLLRARPARFKLSVAFTSRPSRPARDPPQSAHSRTNTVPQVTGSPSAHSASPLAQLELTVVETSRQKKSRPLPRGQLNVERSVVGGVYEFVR